MASGCSGFRSRLCRVFAGWSVERNIGWFRRSLFDTDNAWYDDAGQRGLYRDHRRINDLALARVGTLRRQRSFFWYSGSSYNLSSVWRRVITRPESDRVRFPLIYAGDELGGNEICRDQQCSNVAWSLFVVVFLSLDRRYYHDGEIQLCQSGLWPVLSARDSPGCCPWRNECKRRLWQSHRRDVRRGDAANVS